MRYCCLNDLPPSTVGRFDIHEATGNPRLFFSELCSRGRILAICNRNINHEHKVAQSTRRGLGVLEFSHQSLPLPAPAEQTKRTEAGGEEREGGRQGSHGRWWVHRCIRNERCRDIPEIYYP